MPRTKFFSKFLTPDMVKRAKEEVNETEDIKADTLVRIKNLIRNEPEFEPCMEDWFLLRFLRVKKFDVEQAFKMLTKYYKFKATHSGVITDFKPSDVLHVLEEGHCTFLEDRDDNYLSIGYIRTGQFDVEKVSVNEILAFALILFEIALMQEPTQVFGYSVIDDCSNFSIRQLKHYATSTIFYSLMNAVPVSIPGRLKAFHVVNQPFYYTIIIRIMKMLFSEKLKERIYVHGDNLESLHKVISPEILPQELGGTRGPMSKAVEAMKEKFLSYEDYFEKMNKYGYRGEKLQKLKKS